MINFMEHDFTISKIELSILVQAGKATLVHKNRPSHGLALFLDGERTIYFDDKKIKAEKNTIVHFPKGSNYVIKTK